MDKTSKWKLTVIGIFILCSFIYILTLGDLRDHMLRFLLVYAFAFALYTGAVLLALRARRSYVSLLAIIVTFAVLFRLVLLPAAPVLSDDIYRYLWEGKVDLSGENPFSVPPDDPSLEHLRDGYFEGIKYKNKGTIYPPLAQAVFLLGAAVKPDLASQKVLFTLFDIAVIFVIISLLMARGKNPALCVVYAWSPLVIVESAHSGHLDSLGIFFLMLGLLLLGLRKRSSGFFALALSFLSKYMSVLLVPFFVFKKKYARYLMLYVLVIILGYLPFIGASGRLLSSLKTYAYYWEFNSAVFTVLKGLRLNPTYVRGLLFLLLVVFAVVHGRRQKDILRYTYLVIGFAIVLSPTVYPWYVSWMVPLLCFFPNPAWILFTCLVFASYWVLPLYKQANLWILDEKVLLLEYVPFYFLLIFHSLQSRRMPKRATSGP